MIREQVRSDNAKIRSSKKIVRTRDSCWLKGTFVRAMFLFNYSIWLVFADYFTMNRYFLEGFGENYSCEYLRYFDSEEFQENPTKVIDNLSSRDVLYALATEEIVNICDLSRHLSDVMLHIRSGNRAVSFSMVAAMIWKAHVHLNISPHKVLVNMISVCKEVFPEIQTPENMVVNPLKMDSPISYKREITLMDIVNLFAAHRDDDPFYRILLLDLTMKNPQTPFERVVSLYKILEPHLSRLTLNLFNVFVIQQKEVIIELDQDEIYERLDEFDYNLYDPEYVKWFKNNECKVLRSRTNFLDVIRMKFC